MTSPTLLSFLDAPVLVGDPDGRAAYVNPAFEAVFSITADDATGQPLASLFEGGVREAVLGAVADVCEKGRSARFRARHAGLGFSGLASPIVAQQSRVGFVILLVANAAEDERVHAVQRELAGPVDELGRVFDELAEQMPAQRSQKVRTLVEDGLRALTRLRKRSEELGTALSNKPTGPRATSFDPGDLLNQVASQLSAEFAAARVDFQVHVPARLPPVRGDAESLTTALEGLLRMRLSECRPGSSVGVRARSIEPNGVPSVVVAVTDSHPDKRSATGASAPVHPDVRRAVQELGGDLRATTDENTGRTTAIRLNAAKQ